MTLKCLRRNRIQAELAESQRVSVCLCEWLFLRRRIGYVRDCWKGMIVSAARVLCRVLIGGELLRPAGGCGERVWD